MELGLESFYGSVSSPICQTIIAQFLPLLVDLRTGWLSGLGFWDRACQFLISRCVVNADLWLALEIQ